jgi:hypothetical protein
VALACCAAVASGYERLLHNEHGERTWDIVFFASFAVAGVDTRIFPYPYRWMRYAFPIAWAYFVVSDALQLLSLQ